MEERHRFIARLLDGEKMAGLCRDVKLPEARDSFICRHNFGSEIGARQHTVRPPKRDATL